MQKSQDVVIRRYFWAQSLPVAMVNVVAEENKLWRCT